MASLTSLEYGSFTWRAVAIAGDTVADVDEDPDMENLTGTVTLTPVPKYLLVPGATPPATALPIPVVGTMSGGLMTKNGQPRVKVVATNSTATNPTGFTYTASFDLMYNGTRVSLPDLTGLQVGVGETVDLTSKTPSSSLAGIPIIQGPQGIQGIQGPAGVGIQGPQGIQGLPGPQGIQGNEGPMGQPSSLTLTKAGSPYGDANTTYANAPNGTICVDTDVTNGASMWQKIFGGANGWRVVRGDTGWRNMALDATYGVVAAGNFFGMPNGNTLVDSQLLIRRVNSMIILRSFALQPKQDFTTSTNRLMILPAGFRSSDGEWSISRYGDNNSGAGQKLILVSPGPAYNSPAYVVASPMIDSNWNGFATGGAWPKTNGGLWLHNNYFTPDPWPTGSLPGTAAGTA